MPYKNKQLYMKKKIDIIVNPASGQYEPILSYINQVFDNSAFEWNILITKKERDATSFAQQSIKKGTDVVAVYGGDGTVMEVAQGLCGSKVPLAIIAGGTANILAKELELPIDTQAALDLIASGKYQKKAIDMGQIGKKKFLNRINFGIAADMLKHADADSKRNLGQLAYGVSIVKSIRESQKTMFNITIDGEKVEREGVALIVTNCGNVGIPGYSLIPDISVTDGVLDVIIVPDTNIGSMLSIAGNTLMQKKPEQALEHWKGKNIVVKTDPNITVINDDEEINTKSINIKVLPKSLYVLVPKK